MTDITNLVAELRALEIKTANAILALLDEVERLRAPVPRPIDEWHDDCGAALWWTLPVCEPPYAGAPGLSDWPGGHTHWTPIVCPREPEEGGTR